MPICPACERDLDPRAFAAGQQVCAQCQWEAEHPRRAVKAQPRTAFEWFTLTHLLIAINVVVFLVITFAGTPARELLTRGRLQQLLLHPSSAQLIRWGSNYGMLTLSGQWWRLLTNIFVHIGLVHLVLNMWALWNVGYLAEHIYGRWRFLFLYLFCGISGSLASLWWRPQVNSAGASGAIFGLAGALIIVLRYGRLPFSRSAVRHTFESLLLFAAYNLFYGAIAVGIDNAAHIGGLLAGALFGAMMVKSAGESNAHRSLRRWGMPALAALLLACGLLLRRADAYVPLVQRATVAVDAHQPDRALPDLQRAAAMKPNSAEIQTLLGRAYIDKKQFNLAQARLQRATQLDGRYAPAWSELGALYLATERPQEAIYAFTRATELSPKWPEPAANLGLAYQMAGQFDRAIAQYNKVLALRPNWAEVYYSLGLVYLQKRDYDKAIDALEQATHLSPDDRDMWRALATAYHLKGDEANAEKALENAK